MKSRIYRVLTILIMAVILFDYPLDSNGVNPAPFEKALSAAKRATKNVKKIKFSENEKVVVEEVPVETKKSRGLFGGCSKSEEESEPLEKVTDVIGTANDAAEILIYCNHCKGKRYIRISGRRTICPVCKGTGTKIKSHPPKKNLTDDQKRLLREIMNKRKDRHI